MDGPDAAARSRPSPAGLDLESLVFSCRETIPHAEVTFAESAEAMRAAGLRVSNRARAIATLFPAYSYRRPPPVLLSGRDPAGLESLRRWYGQIDETYRHFPATVLCEAEEVRLGGNVLHYREDGRLRVLYETHRLSDLRMIEAVGLDHDRIDERFEADGPCLLLGSVGSFNYGHWLIDDLPRLDAFFHLRRLFPGRTVTILLPAYGRHMDEVRRRMIALSLGREDGWRAVFYDRTRVYAFRRLHYVTPCSQEPFGKSPEAVAAMRTRLLRRTRLARAEAVLRRRFAGRHGGRKLFVDRSPARGRTLVDRSEAMAVLDRHGFDVIDPEQFSPRQQIVHFARARTVVGLAGAAMTNTVFCKPGARILYISPDVGWGDPFFWDLAAVRGQSYGAVHGLWADQAEGIARRDFTLPASDLETALVALGDRG